MAGKNITQAAAGTFITFALTSDNKLYSWGTLVYVSSTSNYLATSLTVLGLGDGKTNQSSVPVAVDVTALGSKIMSSVSASSSYAMLLTTDGAVFVFGDKFIVRYFAFETNLLDWKR
jgi:alpha-tubulin suppressor-like RCC1 family protein